MKALLVFLLLFLPSFLAMPARGQCPPIASCQPGNAPQGNAAFGMGIYRVFVAGFDTLTNGTSDGYQDYACNSGPRLVRGGTYTLRVETNPNADETVGAWLDLDANGQFDLLTEQLLWSRNQRTHTATFTIPSTVPLHRPLRLRIAADYAAAPLPTPCSTPVYSQTEDYRVLVEAGGLAPQADFGTADTVICSGRVQWQDRSRNSPLSWQWAFGDGTRSTQPNPVHQYAAAGRYTVTLRVCNGSGCDSLQRINYVRVLAGAPVPTCAPATVAYCCNAGITRVRFAGINNASATAAAGYEDFSCLSRGEVIVDQPYQLELTTGANAQDIRVYLDANNDGQFIPATELLYGGTALLNPSLRLVIPASLPGLVYQQPLRLRIITDYVGSPAIDPCGPLQQGQAEDYTLVVHPDTGPPRAGFTVAYQQLCRPVQVACTNTTTGTVTSYQWDFGDGSFSTLATPPVHTYSQAGVYDIQLLVRNPYGVDSISHRVAVAACATTYCTAAGAGGSSTSPASFTRVQLADLDNPIARPLGVGYHDFTGMYTELRAGQSYTLRAESLPWQFAGLGPWAQVAAWIDYNQDGQFGPSEMLGPLTSYSPHQLSLVVPPGATPGATRLRLVIQSRAHPLAYTSCTRPTINASTEEYTVVIIPAAAAPVAGFQADLTTSCSGYVQLRDTSWFGPTHWRWDFGDGSTSTLQHPTHHYARAGTYTVSLQTTNRYGTSSKTQLNYLTVTAVAAGPHPAACLPVGGRTDYYWGIGQLSIGPTFSYAQPPNAPGYLDLTCGLAPLRLDRGVPQFISCASVQAAGTNPNGFFNLYLWLDSNDDGVFDPIGELLYTSGPGGVTQTGTFVLPSTLPVQRPLRLRVHYVSRDPLAGSAPPMPDPCQRDEAVGQVRDFMLIAQEVPLNTPRQQSSNGTWQLYPNPARGQVTLVGTFPPATMVEVYTILGTMVLRQPLTSTAGGRRVVDLAPLPRGVYYVRVANYPGFTRVVLE